MISNPQHGEELRGNERFSGFCKDLADRIADKLGIQCNLWIDIIFIRKVLWFNLRTVNF